MAPLNLFPKTNCCNLSLCKLKNVFHNVYLLCLPSIDICDVYFVVLISLVGSAGSCQNFAIMVE